MNDNWRLESSLRSADAFPVVASLPPKNRREATTGNASALRRLIGERNSRILGDQIRGRMLNRFRVHMLKIRIADEEVR